MFSLLSPSVIEAEVCQEFSRVFGAEGGGDQLTHQSLGQAKFFTDSSVQV